MFNNNYSNNGFGGGMYGVPQGTGYQYNPGNQAAPKQMNNLSQEEIQKLVQKENQFSLQITETEKLRAICNHRRADGMGDALVEDPVSGICRCQICGYEFKPADTALTEEDLKDICANVLDILQTIKLLYINMPVEAAREYYQIIPLIEKIPKLFEYAVKDYAKYEQYNPYSYNNRNMSTMNLFNMLSGALNGMPFGGQQAQPQGQQFAGAPQGGMPQQPNMGYNPMMGGMPPYGMPQQPMQGMPSNGFVMGAPGYAPQTNGFQYNPNQAAPANVQQAENVQATTDGQTVDVKAEFKA